MVRGNDVPIPRQVSLNKSAMIKSEITINNQTEFDWGAVQEESLMSQASPKDVEVDFKPKD